MLNKNIEILSPVGDFECLKAAVQNGANSVYLGASDFNARYSATNFDTENLEKAIIYAKTRGVNVHLVLNILIKNNEFAKAFELATKAYELGVDAIIVQDSGLALTLIESFPDLPIHASTQMTVHNLEGVKILEKLGFKRAVLSRELSFEEIDYICKNSNIEIETFIHGALCVSYSGQCLFSSIIGGRSGNRGKCAGTCRLPYELLSQSVLNGTETQVLDKGYLLSTKDLCGLEYLPKLVEAGVICFKIEGRMKTPEYVATVTRIYRKYLDKIFNNEKYVIDAEDIKELQLVFNRGGFSTGYFNNIPNKDLVFKEKPNHIGLYLGKISKFNSNKGYVTLKLENNLSIGDKIAIDNHGISNNYTISEMMINNVNIKNLERGNIVTIGRMKGDISVNDKVYLVESKELTILSTNSYQNVENKHLEIDCEINILANKPIEISAKIISNNLKNISCNLITDIKPEQAKNAPISKEKINEQFSKTKNTIFNFLKLNINLDDNLFLTISSINELRRIVLEKLNELLEKSIKRNFNNSNLNIKNECDNLLNDSHIQLPESEPKISVLLNILNENFNYSNLNNVDKLYIPLKYFVNPKFKNIISDLNKKFNLYIYMPTIMRKNYINLLNINLKNILTNYNIKGMVISNIGQLIWFNNLNEFEDLEIIGNYTLNVFNSITVNKLKNLNISTFTLSPELDKDTLLSLSYSNDNAELIIYGNAPVMNSNYCVLGKTNKCYKECKKYCNMENNKFYLKDRLGFKFRVIQDNIDTVSTIYNCKTTSIKWGDFNLYNLRIDILDESIEEINLIVERALKNERFEGKEYTNANLNKEI